MPNDRSSEADEPLLATDAHDIARIEAENTLRQFDAAMVELQKWINDPKYRLRPSTILNLNRVALEKLSRYAGVFRPGSVKIRGSQHQPAASGRVPELVEDFCEYIYNNWNERSPIHLSAYALWRLNWIHPFVDGNGRTARIVSYLILCAKLGYRIPGIVTIPEQIAADKQPYYLALEAADVGHERNELDVTQLEALMSVHLATQLLEVHNRAANPKSNRSAVEDYASASTSVNPGNVRREQRSFMQHIENHPVLYGLIGTVVVAILGILFSR
ncbi:Fic family protein [Phyllobacterium sp. 21LDTY02-6]|uniref:Fic family protein n=1 Tax=Phyllobacterium sp. 21LDTY02-6 TaxID=2944903 RepID=UPI00202238A8|nr:Fic family protein [Phyllobacterium sp. 21LDTY02-6]MCO4319688.1 Fic family protein [Phyllobacterium sp. 21LDTY02-6]